MTTLQEARRRRGRPHAIPAQSPPQQNPTPSGFSRVIPLPAWCKLKGFSHSTGKRLVRAGKVKVVRLSAQRVGITEAEDARFMRECESA